MKAFLCIAGNPLTRKTSFEWVCAESTHESVIEEKIDDLLTQVGYSNGIWAVIPGDNTDILIKSLIGFSNHYLKKYCEGICSK